MSISCHLKSCTIPSCKTKHRRNVEGLTFHRFPAYASLVHTRQQWIKVVQELKNDSNWEPKESNKICSRHFPSDSYQESPLVEGLSRRLEGWIVPSLNLVEEVPKEKNQNDVIPSWPGGGIGPWLIGEDVEIRGFDNHPNVNEVPGQVVIENIMTLGSITCPCCSVPIIVKRTKDGKLVGSFDHNRDSRVMSSAPAPGMDWTSINCLEGSITPPTEEDELLPHSADPFEEVDKINDCIGHNPLPPEEAKKQLRIEHSYSILSQRKGSKKS